VEIEKSSLPVPGDRQLRGTTQTHSFTCAPLYLPSFSISFFISNPLSLSLPPPFTTLREWSCRLYSLGRPSSMTPLIFLWWLHLCSKRTLKMYAAHLSRKSPAIRVKRGTNRTEIVTRNTLSPNFWNGINFSDLRFLPLILPFYKMLFMNKLEFSSLTDCLVWISKTMVWFSDRCSSVWWFVIVAFMGKRCILVFIY
jgi:hypothetical protein